MGRIEELLADIVDNGVPVNLKVEQNTLFAAYGLVILGILLLYLLLQLISKA